MVNLNNLLLVEKSSSKEKEIIKIHSTEPEKMQSELEKITGINFSQYRIS